MSFLHDSTPVPVGQDSPEVSVKAPKVNPDLLTEKEYDQIITLLTSSNHDLAIKMAYTWGNLIALLEINGHCLPDGVIPQNLRPQLVPTAQAEAVSFAPHFEETPKYPVMDYPAVEVLSEYQRTTIVQALRRYYSFLSKIDSPGKEQVLQDVTDIQNIFLASMPIKLPMPTAVATQLDRMEQKLDDLTVICKRIDWNTIDDYDKALAIEEA